MGTQEKPLSSLEPNSANPGNGLIPSPEKITTNLNNDNDAPTSSNDLGLGTTSLSTDNNIPMMSALGLLSGSNDSSIGLGSTSLSAVKQNQSVDNVNANANA